MSDIFENNNNNALESEEQDNSPEKLNGGGIFVPGGVPCQRAFNAQCDTPVKEHCAALYYSARCLQDFDPAQANAIISEIVNVIKKSGLYYDCERLDNLTSAIEQIISEKIYGCMEVPFVNDPSELYQVFLARGKDDDCLKLYRARKENTRISRQTGASVWGDEQRGFYLPLCQTDRNNPESPYTTEAICRRRLTYSEARIVTHWKENNLAEDVMAENALCRHEFTLKEETTVLHEHTGIVAINMHDAIPCDIGRYKTLGYTHAARIIVRINGGFPRGDVDGYPICMNLDPTTGMMTYTCSCVYTLSKGKHRIQTYRAPHTSNDKWPNDWYAANSPLLRLLMYARPRHSSVMEEISVYSGDRTPYDATGTNAGSDPSGKPVDPPPVEPPKPEEPQWTDWQGADGQYGYRRHKAGNKNRYVWWNGLVVNGNGVLVPQSAMPKNINLWNDNDTTNIYGDYIYERGALFSSSGDNQWWKVRRKKLSPAYSSVALYAAATPAALPDATQYSADLPEHWRHENAKEATYTYNPTVQVATENTAPAENDRGNE